jgi:uncharacterized protein YcaQ
MRDTSTSLKHLRRQVIAASLFPPTTLRQAIRRLGFVQADPIQSPARAQDLILRHRVKNYRVGDLERKYSSLNLEEDFLYAYGFMTESVRNLLHPRQVLELTSAERQVFDAVSSRKQIHPRDLEAHFGKEREVNAWGGYSKTTTRILQRLHYRGLLRIRGREKGVRLYQAASPTPQVHEPVERLRRLVSLLASIFGPLPRTSLLGVVQYLRRGAPTLAGRQSAVAALLKSGEFSEAVIDGLQYVWATGSVRQSREENVVRFLAPFDPVVWDRRRFEHLWGWPYRFEAYTPIAKRKLGYYALPMLWGDDVIGWVNVSQAADGVDIRPGFVKKRPTSLTFNREFDAEIARIGVFLSERR